MKLPAPNYFATMAYDGTRDHTTYYTEAQLKQAIDDALEAAAQLCDAEAIKWKSPRFHFATATAAASRCAYDIRNMKETK